MNSPDYYIHYLNNPHEINGDVDERERNLAIGDMCDAIRFSGQALSTMDDDSFELADMTFAILNDDEDDKEGRIRDLYDERVEKLAKWLLDEDSIYTRDIKKRIGA